MNTKLISSTEAQNNFGRILDDVVQNQARYVIQRRTNAQAILLSIADLERLLAANKIERETAGHILRELSPVYNVGKPIDKGDET